MVSHNSRHTGTVHHTGEVSADAVIGNGVRIWNHSQVRAGAAVGDHSSLGKNVYVDAGVSIGARCKIQNNVSIYHGVTIEDGVFVGPHVCFTNDRLPRAINPDGSLKGTEDWELETTVVRYGASIGAHSVLLSGLIVGRFALVAAGSVVTRDVPDHALVVGSPARVVAYVCACGVRLSDTVAAQSYICLHCRENQGV